MTDLCDFSNFTKDARGCLPIRAFFILDDGCRIPDDVRCFTMRYSEDRPKREQRKQQKLMSDNKPTEALSPLLPAKEEALGPVIPHKAEEQPTLIASETAIQEIKELIPPGTDPGMATVLLAAVGVAGGGAAWKFYAQHSKNKHEQAMRRLEIEAMRADSRSAEEDNHRKCVAERIALEHKIQDLETRLAASEKKHSLALSSFDPEALEERLEKLEKAAKPVRKRTPRKKAE